MASPFKMKASAPVSTETPSAGNHPAVLVALIDLGTRDESYQGGAPYKARKVYFVWELTAEKVAGTSNNHVIGRVYNLTFGVKSGLRKMVEGWRGSKFNPDDEFDPAVLLGKPCLLNVTHSQNKDGSRTYANVEGAAALPKGMTAGTPQRKPLLWGIDTPGHPEADWLPWIYGESVNDYIDGSDERRGVKGGGGGDADESGATAPQNGTADESIPW